jgi:hypothetical protein
MIIRKVLALIPVAALAMACGGETPEAEAPEGAAAEEEMPAEEGGEEAAAEEGGEEAAAEEGGEEAPAEEGAGEEAPAEEGAGEEAPAE